MSLTYNSIKSSFIALLSFNSYFMKAFNQYKYILTYCCNLCYFRIVVHQVIIKNLLKITF